MKTIEYIPYVLQALKTPERYPLNAYDELNQTQLTEEVWGTSGRNAPALVSLLDYMVARQLINRRARGNAKYYRLP